MSHEGASGPALPYLSHRVTEGNMVMGMKVPPMLQGVKGALRVS